jgi:hypothetical protein
MFSLLCKTHNDFLITNLLSFVIRTRYFLYTAIILIGVWLRFSNGITLHADPDYSGYLFPAIDFLNEGSFTHHSARSFPYPLFVLLLLLVFKTINAIVIVHHVGGIAAAIGMLWLFEKLLVRLEWQQYKRAASVLFISVSALLFVANGMTIMYEKTLRPEGVFAPFAVCFFVLLYRFCQKFSSKHFLSLSIIGGVGFVAFTRFSYAFLFVLISAYFLAVKRMPNDWKKLLCMLVIPILLLISIETFLTLRYDGSSKSFVVRQVFYSHAHIVLQAMKDNSLAANTDDNLNSLVYPILVEEIEINPDTNFIVLRYSLDALQYGNCGKVIQQFFRDKKSNETHEVVEGDVKAYYSNWIKHIYFNYPIMCLKKVVWQIYFAVVDMRSRTFDYFLKIELQNTVDDSPSYSSHSLVQTIGYAHGGTITIAIPLVFLSIYIPIIYIGNFISVLVFIVGIYLFVVRKLSSVSMLLLMFLVVSILTVAFAHSFDQIRYLQSLQIPMIMLIAFLYRDIVKQL